MALRQGLELLRVPPQDREDAVRLARVFQENLGEDDGAGLPELLRMVPVIGLHLLGLDPDLAEQDLVLELLDQEVPAHLLPEEGVHGPAAGAFLGPGPQSGQVGVHPVVPHPDLPRLRQLEEEPFLDELIQQPAPGLGVLEGRQVLAEARPEVGLEIGAGDLLVVDLDGRGGNAATGRGGAIFASGDAVVTMTTSTFIGESAPCCNTAYDGGGIYSTNMNVTIDSSTISGNSATNRAGGILNFIDLKLANVTLVHNSSSNSQSNLGATTPVHLRNSIIAYPGGASGAVNCEAGFPIMSSGYNVSDDTSCLLRATGDLQNVDPLLGPLANNGGLTPTYGC